MWLLIAQNLLLNILLDIIYFPLWWYTGGVKFIILKCWEWMKSGNDFLAPGLWLKNIFVPMYGQWDWQGRLISFFMRLFQVTVRSFALLWWVVLVIIVFWFWLALPILIVRGFQGV